MRRILPLIAALALLLLAGCQRGDGPPPAPEAEAALPSESGPEAPPPAESEESAPLAQPLEPPAPPEQPESPAPSEPEQPPEDPPPPDAPDPLAGLLREAGYTLEDIPGGQLIVVKADGSAADIYTFAAGEDGRWTQYLEKTGGHTGKNGVTDQKTEGDRATPRGLYTITQAFGVEADPGCLLPYRQVSNESYWVDDPDSAHYNQWVEGTADKDWSSAERLAGYPEQYAYAAVIDYNTDPVTPGAGSAIFLHCGGRATAGCVSMKREELLEVLTWLDPARSPAILIF